MRVAARRRLEVRPQVAVQGRRVRIGLSARQGVQAWKVTPCARATARSALRIGGSDAVPFLFGVTLLVLPLRGFQLVAERALADAGALGGEVGQRFDFLRVEVGTEDQIDEGRCDACQPRLDIGGDELETHLDAPAEIATRGIEAERHRPPVIDPRGNEALARTRFC